MSNNSTTSATATRSRVADHSRITSRLRRVTRPLVATVPAPVSAHECEDNCHYCYGPQTD